MLDSPLSWVGGKSLLRKHILPRIPAHKTYVELFAGGAWVLLAKTPSTSKVEILNDRDGELINFWRVLKHRSAEFAESLSQTLASRELWNEWRTFPADGGEVERAVRFYFVIKDGYGSLRRASGFSSNKLRKPKALLLTQVESQFDAIVDRLSRVWIENLTWQKCLELFDSQDTFFYVDPPYRCAGAKRAYAHSFYDSDHEELAARLKQTKGRWLLSYNEDEFINTLYTAPGIQKEQFNIRYSVAANKTSNQQGIEVLFSNYTVAQTAGTLDIDELSELTEKSA